MSSNVEEFSNKIKWIRESIDDLLHDLNTDDYKQGLNNISKNVEELKTSLLQIENRWFRIIEEDLVPFIITLCLLFILFFASLFKDLKQFICKKLSNVHFINVFVSGENCKCPVNKESNGNNEVTKEQYSHFIPSSSKCC
jgi:hypothetical protein